MTGAVNYRLLVGLLLGVATVIRGHALHSNLLLSAGLGVLVALTVLYYKKHFIPIMLFLLPFSPLLKMNPTSNSFFSIITFLVFLALSFTKRFRYDVKTTIITVLLAVSCIAGKLITSNGLSFEFILYIVTLITLATYLKYYGNNVYFYASYVFFMAGIFASSFAATALLSTTNMSAYINVYEWANAGLTRYSGFYGDANYYSAQILVAIGMAYTLLLYKWSRRRTLLLWVSLPVLIYCGSLSVSKSFAIILAVVSMVWLGVTFLLPGRSMLRIRLFVMAAILFLGLLVSGVLSSQIHMYQTRLDMANSTSSLTTGRSDIFANYVRYIKNNPRHWLFGQGLSQRYYQDFDFRAAHNTPLQIVYQLGFIGTVLLFSWVYYVAQLYRATQPHRLAKKHTKIAVVLVLACFLPWLALDILFFDDFFYVVIIFIIGKTFISNMAATKKQKGAV